MKTRIAVCLALVALLFFHACGIVSTVADQGTRVQTTFFGATFGDKNEYSVRDKMQENGIGYGWKFVDRNTWGVNYVTFAGYDWQNTLVRFTDNRFSSISFADTFSSEADALKRLDELKELLQKKYKLQKWTNSTDEQVFYYKDLIGNMVFVTASKLKTKDSNLWTCGINYSWYKAPKVAEEKIMGEI